MDHKPKMRPVLPGATPTPTLIRNNSESNVYASITAVHQNKNSNYNEGSNDMLPPSESSSNGKKASNNINFSKSSQLKAIQKMVAKVYYLIVASNLLSNLNFNILCMKFPFEIRENVSAVINMTLSSTENLQHELVNNCYFKCYFRLPNLTILSKDFHNKEVYYLRQELSKKNQDTLTLNKTLNIYQERVRILEEDIRNLVNTFSHYVIHNLY